MPTGIERIAAERKRQIEEERFDSTRDRLYVDGELAQAAACYATPPVDRQTTQTEPTVPVGWPWPADWWKTGDRIRDLEKAGALCAAEIDRLQAPVKNLYPYQQRVVTEEAKLAEKINRLKSFMTAPPLWNGVPAEEQERMKAQYTAMLAYQSALRARIDAF